MKETEGEDDEREGKMWESDVRKCKEFRNFSLFSAKVCTWVLKKHGSHEFIQQFKVKLLNRLERPF